jgi:LacI family transcriptional regulator
MTKGVTQKEIARRLGVSQALVSRALSGTAEAIEASPVTIARIRKAAADLRYTPNAAALTLKGAPTRTLGVIVKQFDDPFFGHMIGLLQGLARERHYALLLTGWSETAPDPADERILHKYRPDGLMVCGSDFCPPAVQAFVESGRPVVQIGLGQVVDGVRRVAVDEEAGLRALVEYLVRLGHERIGYLGDESLPKRRREDRLRAVFHARGLSERAGWFVRLTEPAAALAKAAVNRWLSTGRSSLPTALIAADDALAQTVLRALHEAGVAVPGDMSLAGIDDIPAARTMIPALTSVRQPIDEMVRHAFRMVTEKAGAADMVVAPELVIRESCAAPGGASTGVLDERKRP